jgi:hypothetical protein
MALFSLLDQSGEMVCDECGSIHIVWRKKGTLSNLMLWPTNIQGHVAPDEPERDDFGPITTRTVRCR